MIFGVRSVHERLDEKVESLARTTECSKVSVLKLPSDEVSVSVGLFHLLGGVNQVSRFSAPGEEGLEQCIFEKDR